MIILFLFWRQLSDMEYPVCFLENMKELLGEEYSSFYDSLFLKPFSGIRINEKKISVDDFLKIAPYDIKKIPYVSNGFYIDDADAWSKHPYYFAGLYYIQEPSAMLPADRLPVFEGDFVLDLCAAPGGKSTRIASGNAGLFVSNDISYSRTIPLVKNLELFGAGNCFVINEDPQKLSDKFKNLFDKIIVDAPCSGEGMFRKDNGLIKAYGKDGPEHYCVIQKQILQNAVKMLKPGGMIMYSTCTFSPIEDEEIILDILKENDDLSVERITDFKGVSGPYSKYKGNDKITNAIHVFPHKVEGEGHFLCLLKKKDNESDLYGRNNTLDFRSNIIKYDKLPDSVKEFISNYQKNEEFKNRDYFINKDCNVFLLPKEYKVVFRQDIHYMRTGLIMGNINKAGKFIPHTALALSNEFTDFDNFIDLSPDSVEIIKYLKGETLVIDDKLIDSKMLKKGYVLIKTGGFPVGFANYDGAKFKNLYEKGWTYK